MTAMAVDMHIREARTDQWPVLTIVWFDARDHSIGQG
jgi:hypothetical protein